MSTRKQTIHAQPIYFVEKVGDMLTTNTENDRGLIAADGFPVQYRQHIHLRTGQCSCTCTGFASSIMDKAQRDCVVPTVHNGRDCKHIRKAVVEAQGWGFPVAVNDEPAQAVEAPKAAAVDYVSFFDSLD